MPETCYIEWLIIDDGDTLSTTAAAANPAVYAMTHGPAGRRGTVSDKIAELLAIGKRSRRLHIDGITDADLKILQCADVAVSAPASVSAAAPPSVSADETSDSDDDGGYDNTNTLFSPPASADDNDDSDDTAPDTDPDTAPDSDDDIDDVARLPPPPKTKTVKFNEKPKHKHRKHKHSKHKHRKQ